jgi:hypothetical protein
MPDSDNLPLRASLLLSALRALLGEVSPALRGVTIGWRDHVILLRSYFDGPISEVDRDSMSSVGAEVIGDFSEPWTIEDEVIRCDAPEPLEGLVAWAYRRREYSCHRVDRPGDGIYYTPLEFTEVEHLCVRQLSGSTSEPPEDVLDLNLHTHEVISDPRRLKLQFLGVRGLRFLRDGSPPSQLHSLEITSIQTQHWEGCNFRVVDVEEEGLSLWCQDYNVWITEY